MNRREFLKTSVAQSLGMGAFLVALHLSKNQEPSFCTPEMQHRGLIRPPGSLEEEDFLSHCIRCQRCSQVCEPQAIQLLGAGYGALEGTPYLIPERVACTLCLKCGTACPTGAIVALKNEEEGAMGIAQVDTQLCVSHNGSGICGACFTVCPFRGKAITQELRNAPVVHPDFCVGCGLCEEACIVDHDKAIRVYSKRRWTS
jgi:ferredoxin-type protein NapG